MTDEIDEIEHLIKDVEALLAARKARLKAAYVPGQEPDDIERKDIK